MKRTMIVYAIKCNIGYVKFLEQNNRVKFIEDLPWATLIYADNSEREMILTIEDLIKNLKEDKQFDGTQLDRNSFEAVRIEIIEDSETPFKEKNGFVENQFQKVYSYSYRSE